MLITHNHYYQLGFPYYELVDIGFPADELHSLYRISRERYIKFYVDWNEDGKPSFNVRTEDPSINFDTHPGCFYPSFVTWVYHKTGVQTYRLVHADTFIGVLFDYHRSEISPETFPNYDFSGFERYEKTYPGGKVRTFWNVRRSRGKVPDNLVIKSPSAALTRPSPNLI